MSEESAWAKVDDLLDLLDDLMRDNGLTCEPHPDNPRCMCSTARALRAVEGARR